MHVLLDRGMVTGSITVHMHESWSFLKYKLTGGGGGRTYLEAPIWDRHMAWDFIRDGHIIVDGASMWCYINHTEVSDNDGFLTLDAFRPAPGRDILFLSEMDDVESMGFYAERLKSQKMTYEEWIAAGFDKDNEIGF